MGCTSDTPRRALPPGREHIHHPDRRRWSRLAQPPGFPVPVEHNEVHHHGAGQPDPAGSRTPAGRSRRTRRTKNNGRVGRASDLTGSTRFVSQRHRCDPKDLHLHCTVVDIHGKIQEFPVVNRHWSPMNASTSLFGLLAVDMQRNEPEPRPRPQPSTLTHTIETSDHGFGFSPLVMSLMES